MATTAGGNFYFIQDADDAPKAFSQELGELMGLSAQNLQGAFDVFTSLIDNYIESPSAPRASYNRAYCLRRMGRENEALIAYERIVVSFPSDPIAGFASLEAARMNANRKNTERAMDFYTRAKLMEQKVLKHRPGN